VSSRPPLLFPLPPPAPSSRTWRTITCGVVFVAWLPKVFCSHRKIQFSPAPLTHSCARLATSDVLAFLEGGAPVATTVAKAPAAAKASTQASAKAVAPPAAAAAATDGSQRRRRRGESAAFTDIPTTNMRKIIAKRLTESKVRCHTWTPVELAVPSPSPLHFRAAGISRGGGGWGMHGSCISENIWRVIV